MSVARAMEAYRLLKINATILVNDRDLMEEAVTLALASGQALYDCLYLALALRQGCEMITAYGKFHTAETAVAAFPNVLAL